jgi:uncharacterized membrane protein YeaQ/YmgE (transglycosylase-associated protein family)
MLLGIIAWVVMGLLVGLSASKIVNLRGDDPRLGIGLSASAAIVGGVLYTLISGSAVSFTNILSLMFAALAAVVAMIIWHIKRTRAPYQVPTSRRSY